MNAPRAILAGGIAGFLAGIAMLAAMLLLASAGIATPLVIIGDRLSVFIKPEPFLALMGRVGGYNQLKQLGVGSTAGGQLLVGLLGGMIYGLLARKYFSRTFAVATFLILVVLPLLAGALALWPVLGTHYRGLPIDAARLLTLLGFALCLLIFERTLVLTFRFLTRTPAHAEGDYSPALGRRTLLLGGLGLLVAGGAAALVRKLYRAATFSYDGLQIKGRGVTAITPNHLFYCVTKNVIDPRVDAALWHLEINGRVGRPATYNLRALHSFPAVEQETTLMCISNGLDAGLVSNARWKGIPLRVLLEPAEVGEGAARVRLHGVDNYTDTIPLEKAMLPSTLIAYEMNGEPLPHRHGFPARALVPGYFGEKHVKWLTRVEVAGPEAKGFYETQGWGPDFIVPNRSRIDLPDPWSVFSLPQLAAPIEVKGMAYGGDRGVARVELSFDDEATWEEVSITYDGGDLAWVLWEKPGGWRPVQPGTYTLAVRATDKHGGVQRWDEDRPFTSGVTGLHKIMVYVVA